MLPWIPVCMWFLHGQFYKCTRSLHCHLGEDSFHVSGKCSTNNRQIKFPSLTYPSNMWFAATQVSQSYLKDVGQCTSHKSIGKHFQQKCEQSWHVIHNRDGLCCVFELTFNALFHTVVWHVTRLWNLRKNCMLLVNKHDSPALCNIANISWVQLVKKEIGIELENDKTKIMVTYMSDNFTIVRWANEYLNYALLLMHCHLEFIL